LFGCRRRNGREGEPDSLTVTSYPCGINLATEEGKKKKQRLHLTMEYRDHAEEGSLSFEGRRMEKEKGEKGRKMGGETV